MTQHTDSSRTARAALAQLNVAYDAVGLAVATETSDETLMLSGQVGSDEDRQAARDLAQPVADKLGLRLDDTLDVLTVGPENAFEDDDRPGAGFGYLTPDTDGDGELDEGQELSADFSANPGTTDTIAVVEDGETYFPPTDPVVGQTSDGTEGTEVLGGFSETSMDDQGDGQRLIVDDELADLVRRELREDALTTDLPVQVGARGATVYLRGEVDTLQDAEDAEAVANRIPAVEEVREELTVRAIQEQS